MKKKTKKVNYKLLNSFLFTMSLLLFFVSFMFESPGNRTVLVIALIFNSLILVLRGMLQFVKGRSITFEILAFLISVYLFVWGNIYQAYWCSIISGVFSYLNHSNMFFKSVLNETYLRIINGTYHKYVRSETVFVKATKIKQGDLLELVSGETVPCDGYVKVGAGSINTVCVTGDNKIVNIGKGDLLFAGFTVLSGKVIVETTNTVADCSLSKTIRCISEITKEKTKKESKIFVLQNIISLIAFGVISLSLIITGIVTENFSVMRFGIPLGLLCAFNPAGSKLLNDAYESVVVYLANKGIIVKNKAFIEKTIDTDTVGFSVKGVLSERKAYISKTECIFNITEDELLRLAAFALFRTGTSMSKIIVSECKSDVNIANIREFKALGTYGGFVKIDPDIEVVAGSVEDLNSCGIVVGLENSDDTIYVGIDGKFAGYIKFDTPLSEDIFQCMNNLRFAGIKNIFVYSHCNNEIAKQIRKTGNLTDVHGKLSDEQIKRKLSKLTGTKVMFRYGKDSADYSEFTNEIGYGGYDCFERYDAVILNDSLNSPANFVNGINECKKLVGKNIILACVLEIILLLMLIFNIKNIILPLIAVIAVMFFIRFNNLKSRYKL